MRCWLLISILFSGAAGLTGGDRPSRPKSLEGPGIDFPQQGDLLLRQQGIPPGRQQIFNANYFTFRFCLFPESGKKIKALFPTWVGSEKRISQRHSLLTGGERVARERADRM